MQHLAEVGSTYNLVSISGIERCKRDAVWSLHKVTFLISQVPADVQLFNIRSVFQMIAKLSIHVNEVLTGSQIECCCHLTVMVALLSHACGQLSRLGRIAIIDMENIGNTVFLVWVCNHITRNSRIDGRCHTNYLITFVVTKSMRLWHPNCRIVQFVVCKGCGECCTFSSQLSRIQIDILV